MPPDRLVKFNGVGMYNPASWIEEGDGLLVSARSMRATWLRKCRAYDTTCFQGIITRQRLNEIKGHPRASMLLLAYAAEMYLKAGVVKVFSNCREEPVGKWLSRKIGHNYRSAARCVELELSKRDSDLLRFLTDLVTKMRYPVVPNTIDDKRGFPFDTDHTAQINERNNRIWNQADFRELCSLVKRISAHVHCIDQDESNPAHFRRGWVGEDGYWVFRLGGNLSPHVTYRLCSKTPAIDGATVRKNVEADLVFSHFTTWEKCKILVDDDDPRGNGFRLESPHKT
jgi:hypothetical protein